MGGEGGQFVHVSYKSFQGDRSDGFKRKKKKKKIVYYMPAANTWYQCS